MNEQTVDLMKWLLIGAASGYVPMGVLIYFLLTRLLESKDQNVKHLQEATIHNKETNELLESLSTAMEKMVDAIGE